jgi:ssDNA thymidine ADP-ribosyltransferase, DarT
VSNIEKVVKALQAARGRLFHFTDAANIDSIREFGVLPTNALDGLGIKAVTGGDDSSLSIDRHKGFDHYVRLSFCRSHPMAHVAIERGSIKQLRILQICPTVLLRKGVLIADRVATANEAEVGEAEDMIAKMDFEATYRFIDWRVPENQARRNAAEKWEALVPGAIGPELILYGL